MKAVILAAGMGTRLGTLIPKPLSSVIDEKTIMDFQVQHLSEAIGIDNIIAVVGYKKELIMEKFPDLTYVYNAAYTHTNTAKSLLTALRKVDEDVVWMNGDVFFEPEVLELLKRSTVSTVLVDTKKCGDEEIKYKLNDDGFVTELSKQVEGGLGEAVGINLVKKNDLDMFKAQLEQVGSQDYFERALENLALSGKLKLAPTKLGRLFCQEVDFNEDLVSVQKAAKALAA